MLFVINPEYWAKFGEEANRKWEEFKLSL